MIEYAKGQGAKKITVTINKENKASNAIANKLGFQIAGERTYKKRGTDSVFADYKYALEMDAL